MLQCIQHTAHGGVKIEPEREIVNWWLNRNGFFTLNNIKAGRNREIGTLALKFREPGSSIRHVEVSCSVSYQRNLTPDKSPAEKSVEDYVNKKFDDDVIIGVIKKSIKELTGQEKPYERAVVLGNIAQANKGAIIKSLKKRGVKVINFGDVLCEVMQNLDGQNYQYATIRSLQLVKYILMAEPNALARLLNHENSGILNQNTREGFLREFLSHGENQRIIQKELNEQIIIDLLKNSSLKRPEKLARVIREDVLGIRSGKKFLDSLEVGGFRKGAGLKKKKDVSLFDFLKSI